MIILKKLHDPFLVSKQRCWNFRSPSLFSTLHKYPVDCMACSTLEPILFTKKDFWHFFKCYRNMSHYSKKDVITLKIHLYIQDSGIKQFKSCWADVLFEAIIDGKPVYIFQFVCGPYSSSSKCIHLFRSICNFISILLFKLEYQVKHT